MVAGGLVVGGELAGFAFGVEVGAILAIGGGWVVVAVAGADLAFTGLLLYFSRLK